MIRIVITRTGNAAAALTAKLDALKASMRELAEKIGLWGVHEIEQNIMDQTMVDGSPMPPLKHLRPSGHSQEMFVEFDFGNLFKTLWYAVTGDNAVKIGSPLEYAIYQNRGTSRRGNGRPGVSVSPGIEARHFIGIRDARVDALREIAAAHVALVWEGIAA